MRNDHIIESGATIREALTHLNRLPGGLMTLFATDSGGRLCGTLTDGDIRRALINGSSLDTSVSEVIFRDYIRLTPVDSRTTVFSRARDRGIRLIPVLDNDGKLIELLDLTRLRDPLPIEAVLMAGGKGERLRPLTLECPKPLLEIGGRPIIDYNIEALLEWGIERIFVTVNYMAEKLIEHFSDSRFGGKVICVREPKRMGTIGSLSLIAKDLRQENLLLMNSDLLTNLSFGHLFQVHTKSRNAMTLGAIPYSVSVPFSILRTEGERVVGLTEKPTFNYFAGAGVYMMESRIARMIPSDEYVDAPDFVSSLISAGEKIGYFPIEGTWIDIGSPDDFRYAGEMLAANPASIKQRDNG